MSIPTRILPSPRSVLSGLVLVLGCSTTPTTTNAVAQSPTQTAVESSRPSSLPTPPIPPRPTGNPLASLSLWVNPHSQAAEAAKRLAASSPNEAGIIAKLAAQPSASWLGEWSGDVEKTVRGIMVSAASQLPVFVVYNVPYRDCGNYSKGGLNDADTYRRWIREVYAGIGDGAAAVVVEPDALGLLDKCLTQAQQSERLGLLRDAVLVLRQSPKVAVYIDAGHPHWLPAETMAARLTQAGVEHAHGFALNTSNYVTTEENTAYGEKLSGLVGGAHFVIDTSRNGNGSAPADEWCNPKGRHIGASPTVSTGHPLVDAWLWTKPPGESDGECNGGPKAGAFWVEQALELGR
jgi:endoglucanase